MSQAKIMINVIPFVVGPTVAYSSCHLDKHFLVNTSCSLPIKDAANPAHQKSSNPLLKNRQRLGIDTQESAELLFAFRSGPQNPFEFDLMAVKAAMLNDAKSLPEHRFSILPQGST
jgi:hypothetical protein